jgi:5-bromo-4-chloroindolyl phosphate hydrolysis protein
MKRPSMLFALIGSALIFASTVEARPHDRDFGRPLWEQSAQIREGVREGDLTSREERRLRENQKELREMLRRFRQDGRLTRHERERLESKYRKNQKLIARLRENDKRRFYRVRISGAGRHSGFDGQRIGRWYPESERLVLRR